jgi:hypothetical protein
MATEPDRRLADLPGGPAGHPEHDRRLTTQSGEIQV